MTEDNWNDANARCMGILLDGRAQETGIRRVGSDSTLLVIVNSYTDVVPFKLPEAVGGSRWVRLIDTNRTGENGLEDLEFGHPYDVADRSLLLFVLRPTRTRQRSTAAERSFQRVIQTIEDASLKSVQFGFD
jgi:glycogen operon protein